MLLHVCACTRRACSMCAWIWGVVQVRVPCANLIGEENAGFMLTMINFNHERAIIAYRCINKQFKSTSTMSDSSSLIDKPRHRSHAAPSACVRVRVRVHVHLRVHVHVHVHVHVCVCVCVCVWMWAYDIGFLLVCSCGISGLYLHAICTCVYGHARLCTWDVAVLVVLRGCVTRRPSSGHSRARRSASVSSTTSSSGRVVITI